MLVAESGYPVSIKGVLIRDGRVLLVHNERDEWELPGGRIEPGEAPEQVEQLTYLLEMLELPNVQLRIIPFEAGWTPLLTGSFILFDSDQAPSMINLELHRGGLMLYAEEDIAVHRRKAEAARRKAMSAEESLELIAKVKNELLEAKP